MSFRYFAVYRNRSWRMLSLRRHGRASFTMFLGPLYVRVGPL